MKPYVPGGPGGFTLGSHPTQGGNGGHGGWAKPTGGHGGFGPGNGVPGGKPQHTGGAAPGGAPAPGGGHGENGGNGEWSHPTAGGGVPDLQPWPPRPTTVGGAEPVGVPGGAPAPTTFATEAPATYGGAKPTGVYTAGAAQIVAPWFAGLAVLGAMF
jgi:hypothetical protein